MGLKTDRFETFIAPARAKPQLWRLALALLLGLAIYLLGVLVVFGAAGAVLQIFGIAYSRDGIDLTGFGREPHEIAILLASFLPMGLAAFAMAKLHGRKIITLFIGAPGFGAHFALGIGLIAAINLVTLSIAFVITPELLVPNLSLAIWAGYLIWALPLLFIQTTAEELVFRGYLQQQLAARFSSAVLWLLLPSILFGFLHYDGTLAPSLRWMIVLATGIFGLIAADITRVTGNLGFAMGLHFANNFVAIFVVAVPGQLSGTALYHATVTVEEVARMQRFLLLDIALVVLIWLLARRALR